MKMPLTWPSHFFAEKVTVLENPNMNTQICLFFFTGEAFSQKGGQALSCFIYPFSRLLGGKIIWVWEVDLICGNFENSILKQQIAPIKYYRVTENAQTLEKTLFYNPKLT